MAQSDQITESLRTISHILLWCIVFGFLFLFIWAGGFMLAPSVFYTSQGTLFRLDEHELNIIHYCGIALLKLVVILFFVFPYAAIRLVLRARSRQVL
jgi:hypothetical protein